MRSNRKLVISRADGAVLASAAWEARSFLQRLRGLMFRACMIPGEAVVFRAASSIHMFFMRFPIDVLYLDRAGAIVKIVRALKPWRMSAAAAYTTIEFPADSLPADLRAGERVVISEA